jgi:diketogulonate reductase-like aldo/keto reductase
MSDVPMVPIGDGIEMPMVGFGTWQLGGQQAYDAVRYALEVGYRHLDTATMYRNEAEVGRALRDSGLDRAEVFLTTKLPPGQVGHERATLAESLRALGTDYVDLWLIHWPPRRSGASVKAWQEFRALRSAGQCRAIGVSNYSPSEIDELTQATGETPSVNQVPWSPSGHDPDLLAALRERGVAVEGYSPLKGTKLRDRTLREIADRHGVTPAQVVLRWHIQLGIIVIPKSARRERVASNFDLFGFSLTDEEMDRLAAL